MKKIMKVFGVALLMTVCELMRPGGINNAILYSAEPAGNDSIKEAIAKLKSDEAEQREKGRQELLKIKEDIETTLNLKEDKDNKKALETRKKTALETRKKIAEELLEIVKGDKVTYKYCNSPKPEDSKFISIKLLGEFPAPEAIEILIDNIFYGRNPRALNAETPFRGAPPPPAVIALIKIGEPVIGKILERIKNKDIEDSIIFIYPQKTELDRKLYFPNPNEKWERECIRYIYGYIINEIYGEEKAVEFIKKQIDEEMKKDNTQYLNNLKTIARWWRDRLNNTHYIDEKWWSNPK